jgi:spermidine synthase
VIDDAHRFLRDRQDQYDVVIVDAAELTNTASDAFHSVSFADLVFKRLKDGGILVAPLGCPTFDADSCRGTLRKLSEKFPNPRVYLMTIPSFPGGQWAVAWCSVAARPDQVAATGVVAADLRCWHPGLQAGMFALPRNVQSQLGLSR